MTPSPLHLSIATDQGKEDTAATGCCSPSLSGPAASARLFLVELLVFLFRRLNKDEEEQTCASLFILDRIVRSNISEMKHHTEKLFIALGPILQSTSIRGFARALGLCARQHLYEIFAILEHWEDFVSRVQLQPSAGGSLEEPASIEQLRSLLLLTYGHVVHSGPTDLILETIGFNILTPMRQRYFLSPHEMLRGKDRARLQSPDHQHALLAISYIGKFEPRLSKEQEAETISTCIASAMIQHPALAKLRGTEVAGISAIRAEMFLEQHLTPTTLLHLFLAIWRFLGADPLLTRGVLHILLYDSPEKGRANPGQTQDRSCPLPARLPPATTCSLWELIGALGQADMLEGREDDLFASCFLAIACPPARHLSGAQQDLPSDASPRR
ncbi:WD repeat-containing protein 73 [Platysternon megacephalum]|uniref:WD repeat-containing protein 73 n=1 Tax=Platysternon megacephalum TaxID=55544 RepID=A0A4D9E196_9SAUR|nr:WD repeat-containing protein 73 [Platysternon megacephalum]